MSSIVQNIFWRSTERSSITAFIDNLERLCYENGESLISVAQAIGKSKSSVTFWKNGSTPRKSTLKEIADHFSVTVDYLLSDEPFTPGPYDSKKESGEMLPLSTQEKTIIEMYRSTTDKGRLRMIQRILNVYDEEQQQ